MAEQALNRLHVFALVDKKGREAVVEDVKAESLTGFEPDASLTGSSGFHGLTLQFIGIVAT